MNEIDIKSRRVLNYGKPWRPLIMLGVKGDFINGGVEYRTIFRHGASHLRFFRLP